MQRVIRFFKNYGAWLILAVNIAVILFIIASDPDFKAGFMAMDMMSPAFIVLCFCVFSLTFICEGAQLKLILRMFNQDYALSRGVRGVIVERYYSNITPTNIGGQPAMVLHLMSDGISGTIATSAMSVRFILYQLTSMFFLLAAAVTMPILGIRLSPVVTTSLVIGSVGTAGVPLLLILCALWPRITYRFVRFVCRILKKIRLVKDADALFDKIAGVMDQYGQSMRMVRAKGIILILVFAVAQFLSVMSVPFLACFACGVSVNYIKSVFMSLILYTSVGFVPTPGAAGAAEAMFFTLFRGVIPSRLIMVAMLIWRVSSYYYTIILGLLESGYRAISTHIKKRAEA